MLLKGFKEVVVNKIFNKLFLMVSMTLIITIIFLIVIISSYYSNEIVRKELDFNEKTLEQLEDYLLYKEVNINNLVRDLYSNSYIMEDIIYALNNEYKNYYGYRLDKYSKSNSFYPRSLDGYFYSYFSQDEDINAICLNSEEFPEIQYLFVYNYSKWNESFRDAILPTQPNLKHKEILPVEIQHQNTFVKSVNIKDPVTLKKIGNLYIYYSNDSLENIVKKINSNVKSSYFILNDDKEILYSYNHNIPTAMLDHISTKMDGHSFTWMEEDYYINIFADKGQYTFLSVTPESELNSLSKVRETMWVLISLLIFIAIFITFTFMRNYSARINQINNTIRKVEKGDLSIRIPENKKEDELSTIASSFNSMLDELNKYIDRYYKVQIRQQQAELKALQAQINPHFLFNTLEVIRMVSVVEGSKTSSNMIFNLSKILRYTLENNDIVPLFVEMENVKQYINLIQLQHPDKLHFDIILPREVEDLPIQKLIIQPIVENYIIHGFKKERKDNQLKIHAEKVDNYLIIRVKDNGKGIDEERINTITEHINNTNDDKINSLGLKNVHQRLRIKYGPPYGISIYSKKDEGTMIILTIPIREKVETVREIS